MMITSGRSNLLKLFLYPVLLYLTHQRFVVLEDLGSFRLRLIIVLYGLGAPHCVEKISSLEVFNLRTSEKPILVQPLLVLLICHLIRSRPFPIFSFLSIRMRQHRRLLQPRNFLNPFTLVVVFHSSDTLCILALRGFLLLRNIAYTCMP